MLREKIEPLGVDSRLDEVKLVESKKPSMRKNVHEAYKRAIGFRRRLEIGENTDEDDDDDDEDEELSSTELFEGNDDVQNNTDAHRRSSSNNISDGACDDDDDDVQLHSLPPSSRSPILNNGDDATIAHTTKKSTTTCPFINSAITGEEGAVCNGHGIDEDDDDCGGTLNNHGDVFT